MPSIPLWQGNRPSKQSGFHFGTFGDNRTQEINVLLFTSKTNLGRTGYLFQGIVGKGHSFDLGVDFLSWMELEGR